MLVKTNQIDKIVFKHPELMSSDSEAIIREMLVDIENKREKLQEERKIVWDLEKDIENAERILRGIQPLFTVEYKMKEVENKQHGQCNLVINNPSDARNWNK